MVALIYVGRQAGNSIPSRTYYGIRLVGLSFGRRKTFAVAHEMSYTISRHNFDKGTPRQFYPCYAEKQAIAYLHHECPEVDKCLIHITKMPCVDCSMFITKYRRFAGTNIQQAVEESDTPESTPNNHTHMSPSSEVYTPRKRKLPC